KSVLDARGHYAHHAFMPLGIIDNDAVAVLIKRVNKLKSPFDHLCLKALSSLVEIEKLLSQGLCLRLSLLVVPGKQAANAHRHVVQASGCVDARSCRKAKIARHDFADLALLERQYLRQSRSTPAIINPLKPCVDQDAIVVIELDHIGHRT